MRFVFFVSILCSCFFLKAQNEVNVWQFGYGAGIDFNSSPPIVTTDGKLNTWEGCASICDDFGKLLFYTDGDTVFNAKHEVMVNGTGLHGSYSSAQSAMIIKQPLNDSLYLVFNPGEVRGLTKGFYYSVVNIRAHGGKGEVITKNVKLKDNMTTESVSAVKHANGQDVWVLFKNDNSGEFVAYKVTPLGVSNLMSFSQPGPTISSGYPGGFTLNSKFSVSGKKYAICIWNVGVCLYDFDNKSGYLSNMKILPDSTPYGVEFSLDESKLYMSSLNKGFFQYDLSSGNINTIKASKYMLSSTLNYGAVQIAPDKKIYVVRNMSDSINVVEFPDKAKAACLFKKNYMFLGGKRSGLGLPPFISTYFSDSIKSKITFSGLCKGDSYQFECANLKATDSVAWNFGDPASGANNTSSSLKAAHVFSSVDSFHIQAVVFRKNMNNRYIQAGILTIDIKVSDYLGRAGVYPLELSKCTNDSLELKAANGGSGLGKVEWNNLPGNNIDRTVKVPGWYIAKVFKTSTGPNCYYLDSTQLTNLKNVIQPNLGPDTVYCVKYGQALSQLLGTNLSAQYNYTWNNGENKQVITVTTPGEYIVKAEKQDECPLSDTIEVKVKEAAFYIRLRDTMMCNDGGSKTVSVQAKSYDKISWSTGENGLLATVATSGIYFYSILNACADIKDSVRVTFVDAPVVNLGKDLKVCPANGYELKSNIKARTYRWSPGGEESENLFTDYTGLISLEVSNEAGCKGTDMVMVTDSCLETCFLPNAFSPNEDGLNELFKPVGNDIRSKGYIFRIYDRWGGILFETNVVGEGWNGKVNETLCAEGVYFYTLEFVASKQKTINLRGTFHLRY